MDSDKSVSETKEEQDRSIPNRVTGLVVRNIAPPANKSCSSDLNGLDLEQISERQRVKTFPECCKHLE